MRLELASCLDADRDAIQRAVRVEVGELRDAGEPGGAAGIGNVGAAGDGSLAPYEGAVLVRVDCAADGPAAGVVLEVRLPDSARRYRYALDWRAQPIDARPRLLGLAVAEAVDASRIELTAIPEPAADVRALAAPARAPSDWTVALVADLRRFSARRGAALFGAGVAAAHRLPGHLRLSADLVAETATVLTTSGAIAVQSLSAAPRIAYRLGGRLYGELGVGVRAGVVRMRGEALPSSRLVPSGSLVRSWLGPAVSAAVGSELSPTLAMAITFELGVATSTATARDLGEPAAAVGGTWRSAGLAIAIAL